MLRSGIVVLACVLCFAVGHSSAVTIAAARAFKGRVSASHGGVIQAGSQAGSQAGNEGERLLRSRRLRERERAETERTERQQRSTEAMEAETDNSAGAGAASAHALATDVVTKLWVQSAIPEYKSSLAVGLAAFAAAMRWSCEPPGLRERAKAAIATRDPRNAAALAAELDLALYTDSKERELEIARDVYGRPKTVRFKPPLTVSNKCGERAGKDASKRGLFYGHTSDFVSTFTGYAGDNAGHIIAFEHGGSNFVNNFWPASPNCNQPGSTWRAQEEYVTAQLKKKCAVAVEIQFKYADPDRPFRATHGTYNVQSKAPDTDGSGPAVVGCADSPKRFVNVPTDKELAATTRWAQVVDVNGVLGDVTPVTHQSATEPARPSTQGAASAFVSALIDSAPHLATELAAQLPPLPEVSANHLNKALEGKIVTLETALSALQSLHDELKDALKAHKIPKDQIPTVVEDLKTHWRVTGTAVDRAKAMVTTDIPAFHAAMTRAAEVAKITDAGAREYTERYEKSYAKESKELGEFMKVLEAAAAAL